jgi:tritrans,polycis-undecaprenyl-diphosphate synthase [geranylgeranyl-diphosphate specific]
MNDNAFSKKREIHVALIPDGNRRWAKKKGRPEWFGHYSGAKKMEEFLNWTIDHPEIKIVSVYGLSTENLKRNPKELNKLWNIYKREFKKMTSSKLVKENNIRVNIIGEENLWGLDFKHVVRALNKATENYTKTVFNFMIAYGSHSEMLSAIKKIAKAGVKAIPPLREAFINYLKVNKPVDLVIRTGGQRRLSNFLLYQAAYSELYFTETLWPDFSRKEFDKIIRWFWEQERRFGK